MFQHPIVTTALVEQHRVDLIAAAQHARDRRVATRHLRSASRPTFHRGPRAVVQLTSTPAPAATR